MAYCIDNQFKCEGENILSITYSINNGAFCIMQKKGEGIVTSYEQYTGPELNVSGMGFADSELQPGETEDDEKYESIEASNYTVSYDAQESETTMFSIGLPNVLKAYHLWQSKDDKHHFVGKDR